MALSMVHLAVAVELVRRKDFPNKPEFYLGSIAPDAIHMRSDAGRRDKNVTHLADKSESSRIEHSRILDLLLTHWAANEYVPFTEGYSVHLLTDDLWLNHVHTPFVGRLSSQGKEDKILSLYYNDCDRIDFDIYQTAPWRPKVWQLLSEAKLRDFANLLTAQEIKAWQDRTLFWFDQNGHMGEFKLLYLSHDEIEKFVTIAADEISSIMGDWRRNSPDPNAKEVV